MTVDQLLAESVPDGTFGDAQPRIRVPWTPAEQDAHWNALAEAIGSPREMRPPRRAPRAA